MNMRKCLLLTTILLIAAACQSEAAPVVQESPPTEAVVATAVPTNPPPTEPPLEPTATEISPTATPEERKMTYLIAYGGADHFAWDQANLDRYLAENPDLDVRYVNANYYSTPVPVAFYIFFDSNRPPDVISSGIVGTMREAVADGRIADISHLWEANGWDDVFPATFKKLVTFDDKQYFVPQSFQWNPVWYRTDIFTEVGLEIPQTWEDLLAACDTLSAAGYVPIATANHGWTAPEARWFSIIDLRLNGFTFHENLMAGREHYDDPRVHAVFEHWAEMFNHNCFDPGTTNYKQAADQLFEGQAAMYNLGEWLSESYDEGFTDTVDFFRFPLINADLDPADAGEIVHLYGAYMLTTAQQPAEAEKFLTYLGSQESQQSNMEAVGRVVSRLDVDSGSLGPQFMPKRFPSLRKAPM
ncbi:MAG: ABC transporter substrate-binding protein [Anaerolineae bacterium]